MLWTFQNSTLVENHTFTILKNYFENYFQSYFKVKVTWGYFYFYFTKSNFYELLLLFAIYFYFEKKLLWPTLAQHLFLFWNVCGNIFYEKTYTYTILISLTVAGVQVGSHAKKQMFIFWPRDEGMEVYETSFF